MDEVVKPSESIQPVKEAPANDYTDNSNTLNNTQTELKLVVSASIDGASRTSMLELPAGELTFDKNRPPELNKVTENSVEGKEEVKLGQLIESTKAN